MARLSASPRWHQRHQPRHVGLPLTLAVLAALYWAVLASLWHWGALTELTREFVAAAAAQPAFAAASSASRRLRPAAEVASRSQRTALKASAAIREDYPDLTRIEDLIYDSCMVMDDTEQEVTCMQTWEKLTNFHREASLECEIDDFTCVVLDVLDRLCANIDGHDGLIILNRVTNAMMGFREHFDDWESAFKAGDTDNSGGLDLQEFGALCSKVKMGMSKSDLEMIFKAADYNGDGVISPEEFSNFLTAAVFAEEPLREFQPDKLARKQPDLETYVAWTTAGRGGDVSWAGLAHML